ncbi:hypothetical protein EDB81DRAFT_243623 [Dactylonectria macrodidyma]|uniref:Uncharacterized protein n=1 Tax=Dactylonectria macrodidyma TaxID=307937 RepID=A0A9P9DDY3_9HYPO|nr:hypothetical protein EDB81DRAFT_243623 [Dactylonectria macrodidyma]
MSSASHRRLRSTVLLMRKEPSPRKVKAELGKRRNPFSSSPDASPSKRTKDFSSSREANDRGAEAVDDEYIPIDPRLHVVGRTVVVPIAVKELSNSICSAFSLHPFSHSHPADLGPGRSPFGEVTMHCPKRIAMLRN